MAVAVIAKANPMHSGRPELGGHVKIFRDQRAKMSCGLNRRNGTKSWKEDHRTFSYR